MPQVKPGVKYGAIIFPLYTNSNIRIRSLSITKNKEKSVRKDIPVYYFEIENISSIHKTKRMIKQNKKKEKSKEISSEPKNTRSHSPRQMYDNLATRGKCACKQINKN